MKPIIRTLFGAVLTLLTTFAFIHSAAAHGGHDGGGGGGTIYYVGTWSGYSAMSAMNSDGSGKTLIGGFRGNPSTTLHNNHRWFIYTYVIPNQYYPDGITPRSEVFALRDDFDPQLNNNADTVVQLTDDITLQPRVGSTDWVPGDAQICFKGRRWSSREPGATVLRGGIYTASLVFRADGNIIGLAEQPATPVVPFPLVETAPGDPWPDLDDYFCWASTGDFVVYANTARSELWVTDLLGTRTRIFAGNYSGQADEPQWWPDGSTIVFRGPGGICTIKPDGRGFRVIIPNTSTWIFSGPNDPGVGAGGIPS